MSSAYLADRVLHLSGPIIAFRKYVFRDVLPAFGNIDVRAQEVANEYYDRIGRQPAGEDEIDMADVAEAADDHSYNWWEMMTSLRQSILNLVAAGLYHLVEQQLATLSRDGMFEVPLRDTKMEVVQVWYATELQVDFTQLASWDLVDELRLVANTVKHGEGGSAGKLKKKRPELFTEPSLAAMYAEEGITMSEHMRTQRASSPLAGEDFFVTEEILSAYAAGTESFFTELAAAIRKNT